MLLFLSFQADRKSSKKIRNRPGRVRGNDSALPSKQFVVPKIHVPVSGTPLPVTSKVCKTTVPALGQQNSTPSSPQYEATFGEFMLKFLRSNGLQDRAAHHIANHGWRTSTSDRYTTSTRRWLFFCQMQKVEEMVMNRDQCLDFLLFLQSNLKLTIKSMKNARSFLSICRKLAGKLFSISEQELLQKCLNGLMNKNPQEVTRAPVCWDIETMLAFLCKLPRIDKISLQALGGKAALLIFLSTMCRSREVIQLRLSGIETGVNASIVTFHLKELTKTFNIESIHRTGLQKLTIRKLPSNPSICPVQTLTDYIKLSLPFRKGEDKLFILPGPKFGAAKRQTVIRWIKDHFTGTGLAGFTVHSTRSSASTNALLLGMPVDDIVAKVGWFSESTFIKNYM